MYFVPFEKRDKNKMYINDYRFIMLVKLTLCTFIEIIKSKKHMKTKYHVRTYENHTLTEIPYGDHNLIEI